MYSDHSFVKANLPIYFDPPIVTKKLVRAWKRIDIGYFASLIHNSIISKLNNMNDIETLIDLFQLELKSIIDIVAPLHTVVSRHVPTSPWFDDECRKLKRDCRRLERVYRRNSCIAAKTAWRARIEKKSGLFSKKRCEYWNKLVGFNKAQPKILWKLVDKILCRDSDNNVKETSNLYTPNDFQDFFKNKIDSVRLMTCRSDKPETNFCDFDESRIFSCFAPCTAEEIREIVKESPNKSCALDIIPTGVFKEFIDHFIPFLTHFVNLSFSTGQFPALYKHAIVTPL